MGHTLSGGWDHGWKLWADLTAALRGNRTETGSGVSTAQRCHPGTELPSLVLFLLSVFLTLTGGLHFQHVDEPGRLISVGFSQNFFIKELGRN